MIIFQFFLEWETFQTKVVQKIKTHTLWSINVVRKSCRLWDNVEKYGRAGQATDDQIQRMHFTCRITEWGIRGTMYRVIIYTCDAYFFSTAITVTRTHLVVTLWVHWLHCCILNSAVDWYMYLKRRNARPLSMKVWRVELKKEESSLLGCYTTSRDK
jgi:hypothetical protein